MDQVLFQALEVDFKKVPALRELAFMWMNGVVITWKYLCYSRKSQKMIVWFSS